MAQIVMLSANLLSHEEDCATPTHRVGRAMPTGACENDRVPQKVVDQVVVKVAARKEEGKRVRPLSDWLLYGTAAKTHTAPSLSVLQLGENLGGRREVLVFMASKGARR